MSQDTPLVLITLKKCAAEKKMLKAHVFINRSEWNLCYDCLDFSGLDFENIM